MRIDDAWETVQKAVVPLIFKIASKTVDAMLHFIKLFIGVAIYSN